MKVWEAYFFRPSSATNLGLSRLLYCSVLLIYFAPESFADFSILPPELYRPTPFFELFNISPASSTWMTGLGLAFKLSLLSSALGLWTRFSLAISAFSSLYLLGIVNCFSSSHRDAVVVLVLVVLCFSRCGDAYSLDAYFRGEAVERSGAYTWPLIVIWAVFSLVFFLAAANKLRFSGLHWMEPERLGLLMHRFQCLPHYPIPTQWGLIIGKMPWVCGFLSVSTMLIEFLMPLAMFSRAARIVLIPCSVLMLVGFQLLLGPKFYLIVAMSLFWVPWDRLLGESIST